MTAGEPGALDGGQAARGRVEVLAAGLLWSLGGVFVKSIAAPAPVIAAGRSLVAAALLLPLVRRRPAASRVTVAASALLYTGVVGLFVWSTKLTSAANAIILQYTAPAFVFLLELVWLRRPPERRNVLTLAGGMAGIVIIYLGAGAGDLLGISLALASGVMFAAWMVLAHAAREVDPTALTFANNLGAALVLLPVAACTGFLPSPRQALALGLMGALQLGLPYLLFTRGVRRIRSTEASLLVLVEPVLNPVWVALVVGEVPARATLAGGAVILASLAVRYTLLRAR